MKKVSSVVWQFFDRVEQNKRCVSVLCKLCNNEYKYFGNTTNLRSHLIKKHPLQWELRQENWDGQKTVRESIFQDFEDESNQSSQSPRRRNSRGVHNEKNVRYSLSIKNSDSEAKGADSMPMIEIQRVDVLQHDEVEENDNEGALATDNLIQQMHARGSDEEWLDDELQTVTEVFEPSKKKMFKKIKRELVTPPLRSTKPKYVVCSPQSEKQEQIVIDKSVQDEYSVFGEYIANKLRKFKAPRTRGNIQQMITTILWQAEYGMFDNAEAVKTVMMCNVRKVPSKDTANYHSEMDHTEQVDAQGMDVNQSAEAVGEEIMNST